MNKWKKKLTKKERGIYASVISVFFCSTFSIIYIFKAA